LRFRSVIGSAALRNRKRSGEPLLHSVIRHSGLILVSGPPRRIFDFVILFSDRGAGFVIRVLSIPIHEVAPAPSPPEDAAPC
jgi:hypothetical protein